jgi:hypothetical protein
MNLQRQHLPANTGNYLFIDFTNSADWTSGRLCLCVIASLVRIVISRLQMSLAKKFLEASACRTVKIGSLGTEKSYPITHAQRFGTRFGLTVLLSIRESEFALKKLFLPLRYSGVITDAGSLNGFSPL